MPISHKHKCIFIHVPKTGGSSIRHLLNITPASNVFLENSNKIAIKHNNKLFALQHCPAHLIQAFYPEYFSAYYKFSFVRHPYNRVLSEYEWVYRKTESENLGTLQHFDRFIKNYYLDETLGRICSQKYLLYYNNKLMVDDVFKFENYDADIVKLKTRLDINTNEYFWLNKSKSKLDKNLLLTEENKNIIHNIYKEDFDTFGYEK